MYVLFEEDGGFKAATILSDNDASLQVETTTGKRAKIKSANVLLRFKEPAPGALLPATARWSKPPRLVRVASFSGSAAIGRITSATRRVDWHA